jgi:hypothetical protein
MLTVYKAGTKLEQRLDKLDSKVDGWVKWAVRFGIGGILVGFGLVRSFVNPTWFLFH